MSPSIELVKPQEITQLPDNAALYSQQQQPVTVQGHPPTAYTPIYHPHQHVVHPHLYQAPYIYPPQAHLVPFSPYYTVQHNQFTSLYVGDLSYDVNEMVLHELFSKVGRNAIASIHVCRDSNTLKSLGYAYVNFYNNHDAERALDTLNHSMIHGKPCRIMWSYRDPTKRKSNIGNVFVKNLEKGVDNAMLYDIFSSFGNILSCKVEYEKGVSKGYGYVHFEKQEFSEKAIQKVNGTILLGKTISVEPFIPKDERFKEHKEKNENKLFFKNMEESVTVEEIQRELSKFGEIESCTLRTDPSGKSKGLGVIEFKNQEDAQRLLGVSADAPVLIGQKPILFDRIKNKIERYTEYLKKSSELSLFINNIDESVDRDLIQAEFSKHGKIMGIKIVQDESGKNKGFGFITYSESQEANNAVTAMNGFTFGQKQIQVSFSNKDQKLSVGGVSSTGSTKKDRSLNGTNVNSSNGSTTNASASASNGSSNSSNTGHKSSSNNLSQYYRNPATGAPTSSQYNPNSQVYVPNTAYYNQVPVQVRYPKANQPYNKSAKPTTANGTPATTATSNGTPSNNSKPNSYRNNNTTNTTNTTNAKRPMTNGKQPYNKSNSTSPQINGDSNSHSTDNTSATSVSPSSSTTTSSGASTPESTTPKTASTSLTLEHLQSLSEDDAKEAIGSEIYMTVMNMYPANAAKITGMILDSGFKMEDLFNLISTGQIMNNIHEGQQVLDFHQNGNHQ